MTQPRLLPSLFNTTCTIRLACRLVNSKYRVVVVSVYDPCMDQRPGLPTKCQNLYLLVDDATKDAVPFDTLPELRQWAALYPNGLMYPCATYRTLPSYCTGGYYDAEVVLRTLFPINEEGTP